MKREAAADEQASPASNQQESTNKKQATEQRLTAPIGLIFHWGVYSVPAFDDIESAATRKIKNGSEWYQSRLEKKFRVSNADCLTQQHHAATYPKQSYQQFANSFRAEQFDPDAWMQLAKSVHASYVILTAKHHDGFCLFPTGTAPAWNSQDVGPQRDLVQLFVDAARKHNLQVGLYYSWMQFGRACSKRYVEETIKPQIFQLQKRYQPSIWWFDGDWIADASRWQSDQIIAELRRMAAPAALLINDRLGKKGSGVHLADYRVFEDRYLPAEAPAVAWEHINTIGLSWGRNRQQTAQIYKSGDELFKLYQHVAKMKGRFLLNLGPNADGTLDPLEVKALSELAALLKQ